MKRNKGYGLIILLIVIAIIAFWAIKIMGKPKEQSVNEPDTSPSGIVETKAKAKAAVNQENAYNQELKNALNN